MEKESNERKPPPKTRKRALTPRQKKLADIYTTQNVSQWKAAKMAGYQGNKNGLHVVANTTLNTPRVLAYMKEQYQEVAEKLGITMLWRCEQLKYIIEKNLESDLFGDHRIALLALDMLNKLADAYPKSDGDKGVTINMVEIKEARVALEHAIEKNKRDY